MFSVTGQVDVVRRGSLSPDIMTLLVFLNEALSLVRKESFTHNQSKYRYLVNEEQVDCTYTLLTCTPKKTWLLSLVPFTNVYRELEKKNLRMTPQNYVSVLRTDPRGSPSKRSPLLCSARILWRGPPSKDQSAQQINKRE